MSASAGQFATHSQQVLTEDRDGRPKNTKRAYDLKEKEWFSFCDHLFSKGTSGIGQRVSYTVTEDRLFGFLFYQSRRNRKKRGKRTSASSGSLSGFNTAKYDWFMADPKRVSSNPVGYSCVNQYRSAVMLIYHDQVSHGGNNSTKEQLLSNRVKGLLSNTEKKEKFVREANFEEKLTAKFAPYQTVSEIMLLEEYIFNDNAAKKGCHG